MYGLSAAKTLRKESFLLNRFFQQASRLTFDNTAFPLRGMKLLLGSSFILSLLCLGIPVLGADLFVDKTLEAAVRQQVFTKRTSKEPLLAEDVKNVSTVKASGGKIRSLKGLEACKALASLELPENEIEDISPLAGLERLQLLDLSGNRIRNIGPVETLKALQYLNLENNQVEDLAPLAVLGNMRSLYLTENRIRDPRPVAKLTKLWSLYLGKNQIEDISSIKNLVGISNLDFRSNKVSDLSPLSGMNQLRMVFMQGNQIKDLEPILKPVTKDASGERRFAPYLRLWLKGNPIAPDSSQVKELAKVVREVNFDYE